jgi:hypothetical protein
MGFGSDTWFSECECDPDNCLGVLRSNLAEQIHVEFLDYEHHLVG